MATPSKAGRGIRAHYVLSTHWDREWYQTFQNYRYQLVRLLDRIFAALEDGRLVGPFQTDGQAIILEDYLEIRPDRRAQVHRLAQEGKLVIGPWYVLPDEFLVSGESLLRNIRLGRALARHYGSAPSQAGFVCDLFGHNSQMPQIFAGFGIHAGLIWRGLNHVQTRHVRWRGADGSELITYRFPAGGYCDYTFKVRHATDHRLVPTQNRVVEDLQNYLEFEAEHTEVDPILLFDGGDHEEWDEAVYNGLLAYQAQGGDDFEVVHTSLDAYLSEVLEQAGRIGTVVEGELREPGRFYDDQQWVIPGVLSSRVWIKQENAACETLLTAWAEPTAVAAHLLAHKEIPTGFLDVAWQWLIKNHPHDSICGCSIDVVHEDMKYRFSQCRQIAERLTVEATKTLAAGVTGDIAADELRVAIFNPLPYDLDETVELTLNIPTEWPAFNEFFGYEPKPAFRIYRPDGQEIPYQRLGQTANRRKVRIHTTKFPETYRTHDIRVSVLLQLPSLGYTTLSVRADSNGRATRQPVLPGLATSERSMANKYLAVTIEANGSLTLLDKRTGQRYERLLTFEDTADIGDGWYHGQAVNDQTFVSTASSAAVALVHSGPQLTTFRILTTLMVPTDFEFGSAMQRSEGLTQLVIDSMISLRPGQPRLEVETTVHNVALDHRLRVLFPSGCAADSYLSDTPFDVVERPIALRSDNHHYRELEVETKPQQTWSAVYSQGRGLAVVSTGLLECAVRDLPERPLALTLLRSTRTTVFADGEPNGQIQGNHSFRYWILPLDGAPDRVDIFKQAAHLAAGLRTAQLRAEDLPLYRASPPLPATYSLLSLTGPAVLTSLRHVDGAIEVRVFNPTTSAGQVILQFRGPSRFARALAVDFESSPTGEVVNLDNNEVTVQLPSKRITTIRLE